MCLCDDPPFLAIGTEISAKFKGAFCEAKVKKIAKSVKCKLMYQDPPFGCVTCDESAVKGKVEVGATVEVCLPPTKQPSQAILQHVKDCSTYTVVFNDGDERTLRRTQLCLKGAKHFDSAVNLDTMPLTKPEQFSTPVPSSSGNAKSTKSLPKNAKISRRESSSVEGRLSRNRRGGVESSDSDSEEEETEKSPPSKQQKTEDFDGFPPVKINQSDLGRVVCVFDEWQGKGSQKRKWYPALVVRSRKKLKPGEIYVRSFKDAKFNRVSKRQLRDFDVSRVKKEELNCALKTAVDKAVTYLEKKDWDKAALLGESSEEGSGSDDDGNNGQTSESESEEEPSDDRDRFVAQFYKFQDERGTPVNKAPVLGGQDLNLYKFYNVVQKLGGYNKILLYLVVLNPNTTFVRVPVQELQTAVKVKLSTNYVTKVHCVSGENDGTFICNNGAWKEVLKRMKLEGCPGATSATVKNCYAKYIMGFDTFYRQLGWKMDETWGSSRPARGTRVTQEKAKQLKEQTEKIGTKKDEDSGTGSVQRPKRTDSRSSAGSAQGSTCGKNNQAAAKPRLVIAVADSHVITRRSATPTTSAGAWSENQAKLPPPAETATKQSTKQPAVTVGPGRKKACGNKSPRGRKESESENETSDSGQQQRKKETTESSGSDTDEKPKEQHDSSSQNSGESKFFVGQKIRASYGSGTARRWYDARVLQIDGQGSAKRFFVHYLGWKQRYDEWIDLNKVRALEVAPAASAPPIHCAKVAKANRSHSMDVGGSDKVLSSRRKTEVVKESSAMKKLAEARKEKEEEVGEEGEEETKTRSSRRSRRKSVVEEEQEAEEENTSSDEDVGVTTRRRARSSNSRLVKKEEEQGAEVEGGSVARDWTVIGQNKLTERSKLEEERPQSAPALGAKEVKEEIGEEECVETGEYREHSEWMTPESCATPSMSNSEFVGEKEEEPLEEDMEDEEEEELDLPPSEGGQTPAYGEDEGWRGGVGSPCVGGGGGKKVNRKRRRRNYSEMVTGTKKQNRTPKKESADSDSEDGPSRKDSTCGSPPKDNLAALKAKIQLEMAQNPEAYKPRFNFTEMDPSWDSEKRISVMQQRLQEIRDTYQKIKGDLVDMERKWKHTQEKRKKKQEEESRKQTLEAVEAEVIDILASSSSVDPAGVTPLDLP